MGFWSGLAKAFKPDISSGGCCELDDRGVLDEYPLKEWEDDAEEKEKGVANEDLHG